MKNETMNASRRRFLKNSFLAGALVPFVDTHAFSFSKPAERLKVHIFSKHLQFLNYKDLAEAAAGVGFDGVDLSVRPNGHVVPERVEEDLPKAVEELKKAGLAHQLMTTAVNEASNSTDKKLLTTASLLIYNFPGDTGMPLPLVFVQGEGP